MHAYPCSRGHAQKNEALNGQAAKKAATQILALADRQRIEKCRAIVVDVLVSRLSGDRGSQDDAKDAQKRDERSQRIGRVDEHRRSC